MFGTVFGLPVHPLVVHAVVVLIPLAGIGAVVVALWPSLRRQYGPLVLVVTTIAVMSVPIATQSGEALEDRVPKTALVERHADLGEQLLPFAAVLWLGVAGLVAAEWYRSRGKLRQAGASPGKARHTMTGGWIRPVTVTAIVLALIGSAASGVQVVRIGHSGASAAWSKVAPAGNNGGHPEGG